jgi:glutathione synthase/RimK-type ligase-like ATP-grasp enzyme
MENSMKTKHIAIHQNKKLFDHSTLWTESWKSYCEKNQLDCVIVDCYESNIMEQLKKYDYLLWNINNYSYIDMEISRSILFSARQVGIKIFPDYNDMWHYDDKIAETYLLQSVDSLAPQSWIFYSLDSIKQWLDAKNELPIVAKLRCGSGSHNVKLLKSKSQILAYAKQMLGNGLSPHPSLIGKAKANYDSSKKSWTLMKSRIKRIPEFYRTLKQAKQFPNEKGYVFLQEFIPNNGYDLKVVVIGDKLGFIGRHVRKNDFRASGGGDLFFDKSLITSDIIQSAFNVSDILGFQCMGYDYVVNSKTGKGLIVEMSYAFSHTALLQSNGYFDRNGDWYNEPLNAPEEIMKNLLL